MTDPTRSIRGGAAGVVSPTYTGIDRGQPPFDKTVVIDRNRGAGPQPTAVDRNGLHPGPPSPRRRG